jgi:thioredoxin 1
LEAERPDAVARRGITGGPALFSVDGGFGMSEHVREISDDSFEAEVEKSATPVFVDFWAPWCGPCRSVAPIVEELATQYEGKVKVAKINVDDAPEVAQKFMVTSIPTFILFKNGQAADRTMGAMPKGQFQRFIDRNL